MDISAATVQKLREFAQVTAILREKNITYKWGFPPKLMVTFQNQTINISTPKEGIKMLLTWGLISTPLPNFYLRHSQASRPRLLQPCCSTLIAAVTAVIVYSFSCLCSWNSKVTAYFLVSNVKVPNVRQPEFIYWLIYSPNHRVPSTLFCVV